MSIVVFWLHDSPALSMTIPEYKQFTAIELKDALVFCQQLRNGGARHVTLSSENPDSVGRPGVVSVQDGLLPNGEGYGWKKRRV